MPRLEEEASAGPLVIVSDRSMSENKTRSWRSLRPVIDPARCTGCILCWKFCPEACILLGKAKVPSIDLDYCTGCGVCAAECPPKCISLQDEEALR